MLDQGVEEFVRAHLPEFFIEHHVGVVVEESEKLCNHYPKADKEIVRIAAWLHDVGHTVFGGEYYTEDGKVKESGYRGRESIHGCMDNKGRFIEKGEPHQIRGVRLASNFLASIKYPNEKTQKVLHCIESHRSSKPPKPKSIEAMIVASADNLSHFIDFDFLAETIGQQKALAKIERDLATDFMLPQALEKAQKLHQNIRSKTGIKEASNRTEG